MEEVKAYALANYADLFTSNNLVVIDAGNQWVIEVHVGGEEAAPLVINKNEI
tara:strand:- start:1889 stop:2044 length:156 start_codon:yes stop_codon:yes gene_type:complete